MCAQIGAFQAVDRDMRVDLGRTEVGVSQEFLHDAQIGAVVEQMGREGMAQHVRMHGLEIGRASCRETV